MAGTMVHLTVAAKLWRWLEKEGRSVSLYQGTPLRREYFIAGNICPDGIMAREGYRREMKLHTHFRDGIPDGSFENPGNVPLFEERMKLFWRDHLSDEKESPGLYLGYVTHMMTDERYILQERPKFFQQIARIGLTKQDRETYVHFNRETDLVDFWLLRNYPELQEARGALMSVPPYEIRGMITEEELTDSRRWILDYFFEAEHPNEMPGFISCQEMATFIDSVSEEIKERLWEEGFFRLCRERSD